MTNTSKKLRFCLRVLLSCITAPGVCSAQATADTPPTAVAPATPAADGSMSEAQLLHLWLEQSREVASLRTQIGAARFDVVTAGLWPNPQLGLSTSIVVAGRDHPPDGIYNWGPQLTIPLPIFGQIGAREREAKGALSVTEMDLVSTLWSRATDLEQAVVQRTFTQAQLDELERNLVELARIERIVQARAAAGANPQYDVLRVATTEATFQAGLSAARLKRDQLDTQLASLLAVPGFTPGPITRNGLIHFSGPAQLAELEKVALSRRPDLLLAERGVTAAQASAARYRKENLPLPSLQIGGYVTHEYPSLSLQAGVALNLPLFDRNQGQIGRAEVTAKGQQLLAESLRARIRAEVRGAVAARESAQTALQSFEHGGVGATRELIERAEVSYRAGGDFSILDLLDAYRAVWEARAQRLELEHTLADAEVELARALAWLGPLELSEH